MKVTRPHELANIFRNRTELTLALRESLFGFDLSRELIDLKLLIDERSIHAVLVERARIKSALAESRACCVSLACFCNTLSCSAALDKSRFADRKSAWESLNFALRFVMTTCWWFASLVNAATFASS